MYCSLSWIQTSITRTLQKCVLIITNFPVNMYIHLCIMYILHTLRWNTKLRTQMQSFKYIQYLLQLTTYICILIYCTHTYFYLHITAVHRPVDNFEKVVNPMIVLFVLFFQKKIKMFTSWYRVTIFTSNELLKCFGLQKWAYFYDASNKSTLDAIFIYNCIKSKKRQLTVFSGVAYT